MTQARGERPRYRMRLIGVFDEPVEATVDGLNRWETEPRNATRERALAYLAAVLMPNAIMASLSLDMKPAVAMLQAFPGSEILEVPTSEDDDPLRVY